MTPSVELRHAVAAANRALIAQEKDMDLTGIQAVEDAIAAHIEAVGANHRTRGCDVCKGLRKRRARMWAAAPVRDDWCDTFATE